MFQILEMTRYPVPFPQKLVGEFASPGEAMKKLKWTRDEMERALQGRVVRDRYVLEWAPEFLRKLAVDSMVEDYPDGASLDEIALLLNLSVEGAKSRLNRALRKLRANGGLTELLLGIRSLREHRRHCRNSEITMKAKITVTMEG